MFDRNLMKLAGMGAILGALALLAVVQAGFIIGMACLLSNAISMLWSGSPLEDALPSIAAFLGCFTALHLARFGQDAMLERYSQKQASELRTRLLEAAIGARLAARQTGSAVLAASATDGIDEVQTYLRIIPPKLIGMMAISLPLLVYVFFLDWPSGIILAVMFPTIMFFMVLLGRQARARSERQYETYTRLTNHFMDTLRGMRVLKAFGAAKREASAVYERSEDLRRATVRTLATATLSSAVLDLCATFGVAAVAMMLAFRLMDGSISLCTGLAVLVLAPEFFAPIRSFASDYHASLDGKNALSAIFDILGEGQPSAEEHGGRGAEPIEGARISTWNEQSTLVLHDVGYEYEGAHAGISHIDLDASGFERIGIVGKSGSGKSTLASLLAGFTLPSTGSILIDGVPANLSSDSWTRQVRYIPQHPYVFRASLADNIRFYNPSATDDDVRAVVHAVGLDDLVSKLPEGIETMVGEGLRGLSGGEAHRVALARVLMDDSARVLVFDEPTAHLDIETELDLKQPMLDAMEGKLVFFATHRMHWTSDMDRVIVLGGEHA